MLKAVFQGENKGRLWKIPEFTFWNFRSSNGSWSKSPTAGLLLPFRQAICITRRIVIDALAEIADSEIPATASTRALSQRDPHTTLEFARWSRQDWLAAPRKEKNRQRDLVQFVLVQPSRKTRRHYNVHSPLYAVWRKSYHGKDKMLEGHIEEDPNTEAGNPQWEPDKQLRHWLDAYGSYWLESVPLPFLHWKALLRHTAKYSISFQNLTYAGILEIAEFARNQEMALNKVKSR